MASVGTYLNFAGNAEEAFTFYAKVFRAELGPIMRFGEMPPDPNSPPMPDHAKNMVLHVGLPILDGHLLMGSDTVAEWGQRLNVGNNVYVSLTPDTRDEADRLFAALAEGGEVEMPMADMFWGDYFGSLTDRYGIKWMVNIAGSGSPS